ncbi:hypothetical protein D918_01150 [Trichuris suis]|nr:hypothetical protein D918_01150 [Trichuris suis]
MSLKKKLYNLRTALWTKKVDVCASVKWNDRECVTPAELRSSVSELVRYVIAIKK